MLEFILERVTDIVMGTEVDSVNEFEDILCLDPTLSIRKGQDSAPPADPPAKALQPAGAR